VDRPKVGNSCRRGKKKKKEQKTQQQSERPCHVKDLESLVRKQDRNNDRNWAKQGNGKTRAGSNGKVSDTRNQGFGKA